jgi:hypothetical protein
MTIKNDPELNIIITALVEYLKKQINDDTQTPHMVADFIENGTQDVYYIEVRKVEIDNL